jgi:dipeptidyl aminopeptidase/acylaminoacyl peptidase
MVSLQAPITAFARVATIAFAVTLPLSAEAENCTDILPPLSAAGIESRDIDPLDLARLRDMGPNPDMVMNDSPIAVSPDGGRIAVHLRRGNPASNSFCQALVVVDLAKTKRPAVIDQGGDLIRIRFKRGPLEQYLAGDAQMIRPIWSPDGRRVAFLKRQSVHNQVWIAAADGSGSRQLSDAPVHVEAFDWNRDGSAIIIRTRPKRIEAIQRIKAEALTGYVYDERWSPVARNSPSHREPEDSQIEAISLTGQTRTASLEERQILSRLDDAPEGAFWFSANEAGTAWFAPRDRNDSYRVGQLKFRSSKGTTIVCQAASCTGRPNGVWLQQDGKQLFFLRRTGWGNSQVSLYIWTLGQDEPRRVLTTRDHLLGCRWAGSRLLCALEQSDRPRRIVSIDPATGAMREVFDPNPEFRYLRLGKVERLEWSNNRGIQIYGDLVMPPRRKPQERVPLLLVQYRTRGFLRGGTGDEMPIYALAAQGFAVLSIERPADVADLASTTDPAERIKLSYGDWADRKSVMSAYATGIELLDRRGLIDRKRVGIHGFSDGNVSMRYALLNSSMFSVAAGAACCEEPKTHFPLLGLNGAAQLRAYHYPAYNDRGEEFWQPYSIALNAARFRIPLLIQASDDEYLAGLETFTSLREAGAPMDMIVFPDEHHTKWQPAHRLAMYRRYIAWFSFWLKGDAGPFARSEDVDRWQKLRLGTTPPSG